MSETTIRSKGTVVCTWDQYQALTPVVGVTYIIADRPIYDNNTITAPTGVMMVNTTVIASKEYVTTVVGDINTILDDINGEVL